MCRCSCCSASCTVSQDDHHGRHCAGDAPATAAPIIVESTVVSCGAVVSGVVVVVVVVVVVAAVLVDASAMVRVTTAAAPQRVEKRTTHPPGLSAQTDSCATAEHHRCQLPRRRAPVAAVQASRCQGQRRPLQRFIPGMPHRSRPPTLARATSALAFTSRGVQAALGAADPASSVTANRASAGSAVDAHLQHSAGVATAAAARVNAQAKE